MKRTNSTLRPLILFGLAGILTAVFGCGKTGNSGKFTFPSLVETNVRLVPDSVARKLAIHFKADSFYGSNNGTNHYPFKSSLHGNNKIKDRTVWNDGAGKPAIYIYNFEDNAGFLFISADSSLQPVLAFVEQGTFTKEKVPSGLIQWANKTMENIELVRTGAYKGSKVPGSAWGENGNPVSSDGNKVAPSFAPGGPPPNCKFTNYSSTYTVGPFLPTTWGQECSYNELCGATGVNYNCTDGFNCSTSPCTGCVATAVAQLIYFWHPATQYNYNYATMPLASGSGEVQRLMRDIGLPANVNMQYGCNVNGGSGADGSVVPNALKTNFGFSSANYAGYNYNTVLSNITNNLFPVLLNGCSTQDSHWFIIDWWDSYSDCHEWVCDGYTATTGTYTSSCNPGIIYTSGTYNILFHMNWGWHELAAQSDFNGWFSVSNWTVAGAGPNGNSENFQYAQGMTTDIHL